VSDLISFNIETMQRIEALKPGGVNSQAMPLKAVGAPDREDKQADLKKACSEFESLFLNYMLKAMRETVPKTGLLSGGRAESVYSSMMDMHLSREIAMKRSIGLASFFQKHLDPVTNPETEITNRNSEAISPGGNTGKTKRGL